MIETKEKEINGVMYSVTQFPARRALKIKAKLLKLVGPSILLLAGNSNGDDLSNGVLGSAAELLVSKLDETAVINLIIEILSSSRRQGKELTESHFDMVYAGNFSELYKAIAYVLQVNFDEDGGGFLGAVTGLLKTKTVQ